MFRRTGAAVAVGLGLVVLATAGESSAATVPAATVPATTVPAATAPAMAYVANAGPGTVTAINTTTNAAAKQITVGATPFYLAATPNGKSIYVANTGSGNVTPISTATGKA
jgi:YVTN family beta-propeller protein